MKRLLRRPFFAFTALVLFGANLCAQNFVYTNDDPAPTGTPNTVSAFSVNDDGSLTPVPGSPFATGGTSFGGGFFGSGRITVCAVGSFLYVANNGSNSVSGFSIDTGTGALTPVTGSPFPTGGFAGLGISLAATPDGQFLIAAHDGVTGSGNIRVFAKNPDDGSLMPVGPLFPVGDADGIKVTPDGQWLAVAQPDIGEHGSIAVFGVGGDGTLTPVAGSPFPARAPGGDPGVAAAVDVDCQTASLFASEAKAAGGTTTVDTFTIGADGSLTAASTFMPLVGFNSNVPLLSPDDTLLFVSNQDFGPTPGPGTVTVFTNDSGNLTLVSGSPFFVGGPAVFTSGMATDQAGVWLYTANRPNLIGVFNIDPSGTLTPAPDSPFSTGQPPGLLSLTGFPPKSCSSAKAVRRLAQ